MRVKVNTVNSEVNVGCWGVVFSHLPQELFVGENTVLIRESLAEVIERGHAISAKRTETISM